MALARDILVLAGPTGSGKTPVAFEIAKLLDVEIISADSRQVYRFMDIGTAKPSREELSRVPHWFVDDRDPGEPLNAAQFGEEGRKVIDGILARGRIPLVVGGSGLYIRGLVDGFFEGAPPDEEMRAALYDRLASEGAETLLAELRRLDPEAAAGMLPSNTRRIVRALEVCLTTGRSVTEMRALKPQIDFRPRFAGLAWERKALYARIDARAERMIAEGLLDEARALAGRGYPRTLNALLTVGYREAFAALAGEITREEMAELIKRNTRRYAKRQLTWFRRDSRIRWFAVDAGDQFPDLARRIVAYFRTPPDSATR